MGGVAAVEGVRMELVAGGELLLVAAGKRAEERGSRGSQRTKQMGWLTKTRG